MAGPGHDFDVIVIGGGPAGATAGALVAMHGYRSLILEKDLFPRDHVGESLTLSTNQIFRRLGFQEKVEQAGFPHKLGVCWTAPRSPVGTFVSIRMGEFPPPGAGQIHAYNVDRALFDTLLLRHAHEKGAKVLQGARVGSVLFEGDRAVGVRAVAAEGWERDLSARFVVDASGRRCVLASQLGLKRPDTAVDLFSVHTWFRGVEPNPPGFEGMIFQHFLDLERSWAWQIPLRDGLCSVGVVTDRRNFHGSGRTAEEFFGSLLGLNRSFRHAMRKAERARPWWIESDYSYRIERLAGPGWLLVGDALRSVDPVFSTGVDVAMHSANHAFEAVQAVFGGQAEAEALADYERRVGQGVQAWYELVELFFKLRNLFAAFAVRKRFREKLVRILQGNLYMPESLRRAREMIELMEESYRKVEGNPASLLRPGALIPEERPVTDSDLFAGLAGP
jgi:flavin-dependent dehydrogenase